MKTIKSILVAAVILGATSFTQAQTMKKNIDTENSSITWTGKKVLGSHTGTIKLKEGTLMMEGETITGGMFTVDMTSINVTDLRAGGKEKLEGHLKSDDFFGVATFPEATLTFTKVQKMSGGYEVDADLTIKGKTESISFDLSTAEGGASTSFKIDRTKHDVRFGSGSFFDSLGDNTISDKFKLDVDLKF